MFALAAALAQAPPPPSAEPLFQKAVQLQAAGDAAGAIEQYKAYLKLVPNRAEAISNLGAALAKLGRMTEAIEQYNLALKKAPDNPNVRLNLALAYYKTAQIGEAVRELQLLHRAYPEQLRVAELLGDCYLRQGEYQRVIDVLTTFERKNPEERAIAYLLGMALINSKHVPEGERIIDRLFRSSDTAEAHLLIGTAKLTNKDVFGGKAEIERAIQLNPKVPGIYSIYAAALKETDNTEENVAAAYRKALEYDPNDFDGNLWVGLAMRRNEQYDGALEHLERALLVRPGSAAVRYQIALVHVAQGKLEIARQEIESVLREYPQFYEPHVTLASVYYRLNRKADGDREREIVRKLYEKRREKERGEPSDRVPAQP
jgi:tetratricopeptide (TPR) repeat protein